MTEPAESPELGSKLDEVMKKMRDAMYWKCLFHNVDFHALVDEH